MFETGLSVHNNLLNSYVRVLNSLRIFCSQKPVFDVITEAFLKMNKNIFFRPELKGGVSMVRELHVYGSVVPVAAR